MRSRNVREKKEKERKQEETEEERREREPGPGAVFVKLCGQLLLAKMWAGGLAVALVPIGFSGRASRRGARNREICRKKTGRQFNVQPPPPPPPSSSRWSLRWVWLWLGVVEYLPTDIHRFLFFPPLPWCLWCEMASFLPVSAAVRQQSTTMPLRLNSVSSLASSRTCSSFSTLCSQSRLTQRRKSSCVTGLWMMGSSSNNNKKKNKFTLTDLTPCFRKPFPPLSML